MATASTSPALQTYALGDFDTLGGETIKDAFIAYKTWGNPESPAVLYPTWYSGSIEDNEWLIGPGMKGLNPANYFIVVTALFGNGQSVSPSNYSQDASTFPATTMSDNVRAQHLLVTQHLKITTVHAVVGWSMGAAQSFQWAAQYPEMVQRILPFCGAARTAHHNITFLRSLVLTLKLDANYQGGKYNAKTEQPQEGKKAFAAIYSGWGFSQSFYREELFKELGFNTLDDFLTRFWEPLFAHKDANNLLHMLDTWITADITCTPGKPYTHDPKLGRSSNESYAQALASIKARSVVMPALTDLYFPPEDSKFEVANIGSNATLDVIPSIWGHFAGGPGLNPVDVAYVDAALGKLLKEYHTPRNVANPAEWTSTAAPVTAPAAPQPQLEPLFTPPPGPPLSNPTPTPPMAGESRSPFASSSESIPGGAEPTDQSPRLTTSPLPSPEVPTSPSSSNRFGLTLGSFIHRRPRGSTNPPSMTAGENGVLVGNGPPSPRTPNGSISPGEPPSPGGDRERGGGGGYGFPSLRRQLSKRPGSASEASGPPPPGAIIVGVRPPRRSSQPAMLSTPDQSTPAVAAHAASGSRGGPSAVVNTPLPVPSDSTTVLPPPTSQGPTFRLRLVPHLESSRSLHFDPIDRDLSPNTTLSVGRFTDRSNRATVPDPSQIAFKSKVVSRGHAELRCDDTGKFFIKDTKSSSGTFLNHIRLSPPGTESRPFQLKDGDILQLGVDYQGGVEQIYRGVKIRVELNRAWQREMNSFNTNALAQLRALGGATLVSDKKTHEPISSAVPSTAKPKLGVSVNDCCICLYPVTVCQALFIAPCSHVTHFKCIRPLVLQNYPGFSCPLCRTYADLEADVELDDIWQQQPNSLPAPVEEETDDDNAPVTMEIEGGSGISASRPASIRARQDPNVSLASVNVPSNPSDANLPPSSSADPNQTIAIDMPPAVSAHSHDPQSVAAAFMADQSLTSFDAATPPNSTFLSTLAETGPTFFSYHPPAEPRSLAMAMASSSSTPIGNLPLAVGGTSDWRGSFGSEDETDGAKETEDVDVDEEMGDETEPDGVRRDKGKGKEKERAKANGGERVGGKSIVEGVGADAMEGVDSN